MKKGLLTWAVALALVCLSFGSANAVEKQISTSWAWPGVDSEILGFHIKDADNTVVVSHDVLTPSARTATFNMEVAEGSCITLYVVAVGLDDQESGNSNIINYCLPKKKVVKVDSFSFTIE